MKKTLKFIAWLLLIALVVVLGAGAWMVRQTLPQREGQLAITGLSAPVSVRYDERGVPHLKAENEADLYRALGYVHAQDRLFQMEMVRRLAKGELAEILGPGLVETDKLFRTLGIRQRADEVAARLDPKQPVTVALTAYLDGVNQFQARNQLPLEYKLLGIKPRPFTPQDTLAVSGYLAYSFAAAFRTEPLLTQVRDKLGADHLRIFREQATAPQEAPLALNDATWTNLGQVARMSLEASEHSGLPQLEGSNAWALSGKLTASGKPLLAGDPHISFALPAVWYEAHLNAPGFELYGHFQALTPFALLGHNQDFGWSLTMFQNDDIDLVAEKTNPANPQQVWHRGQWVDMASRTETIQVKNAAPVELTLRRSPHGPIITDAFNEALGGQPVAMWWAFLETENPVMEAFYDLNRANSLDKGRAAVSKIHAPGLNVVWTHKDGDIAWWAAARLPQRPAGADPSFILDASRGEAEKTGFLPFSQNPQEENPARGYIVSANQAPAAANAPAGYYNLSERARRINAALQADGNKWDVARTQALQQDPGTAYGPELLKHLLPELRTQFKDTRDQALLQQLAAWDGRYTLESTSATVFSQLLYEVLQGAMKDELPALHFENLLKTRAIDHALPRLVADAASPWWDDKDTAEKESRAQVLGKAWTATLRHLEGLYGADAAGWTWQRAHTVTHGHPLGKQKPLNLLLDVGPFAVPGGREVPNNLSFPLGPAPWKVTYGPSTRRVIDWGQGGKSHGINPVGQSGVVFDRHYKDQAPTYHQGGYMMQHLLEADVLAHTRSTLNLVPAR